MLQITVNQFIIENDIFLKVDEDHPWKICQCGYESFVKVGDAVEFDTCPKCGVYPRLIRDVIVNLYISDNIFWIHY